MIGITAECEAREGGKKHLGENLRSRRGVSLRPKDVDRSLSDSLDRRKKAQFEKMNKQRLRFWKSERDMPDYLPR